MKSFKYCLICGKKFFKKPSHSKTSWEKAKYCSVGCANESFLKAPRIVVCAGCGKRFKRNTADGVTKAKYCSYKCFVKHRDTTKKTNYNPNRHSKGTILCACGCGTRIPKYDYRGRKRKYVVGHTMIGKQFKITPEWLKNIKKAAILRGKRHSGKNHWNWKGGVTGPLRSIRHSRKYKEWRLAVYKKDYFRCHHCGKHCSSKNIIAHHLLSFKNYPELRFDIDNGITLCRKCHWDLHKHRWSLI